MTEVRLIYIMKILKLMLVCYTYVDYSTPKNTYFTMSEATQPYEWSQTQQDPYNLKDNLENHL